MASKNELRSFTQPGASLSIVENEARNDSASPRKKKSKAEAKGSGFMKNALPPPPKTGPRKDFRSSRLSGILAQARISRILIKSFE